MIMNMKQKKIRIEPRIKLNYSIYIVRSRNMELNHEKLFS